MLDDIDRILVTRQQIARRVAELGQEISRDLDRLCDGNEFVMIPVLTGSIIFVADLMRQIPKKVRISPVMVSSYPGGATTSQGVAIIGELPDDLAGKHILIVDDILDSGSTIKVLREALLERGARSVRVCVLLRKDIPEAQEVSCEYVGFDIPNEFVVGYGLDYDNYYRNLPDVAVLKKEMM